MKECEQEISRLLIELKTLQKDKKENTWKIRDLTNTVSRLMKENEENREETKELLGELTKEKQEEKTELNEKLEENIKIQKEQAHQISEMQKLLRQVVSSRDNSSRENLFASFFQRISKSIKTHMHSKSDKMEETSNNKEKILIYQR